MSYIFCFSPVYLISNKISKKYLCQPIEAYDAFGRPHTFTPRLQVQEDVSFLNKFADAVKNDYKDGVPLHVADPDKSVFKIMTEEEFKGKSVYEIQEIFRHRHIIVTGIETPGVEFGSAGLAKLARLDSVTHIQGELVFTQL